ncbi:hypothetical protein [Acuticoccus sediminis]|nr:hypothetical protein [Acuticoccus sediminis]
MLAVARALIAAITLSVIAIAAHYAPFEAAPIAGAPAHKSRPNA